MKFGVVTFPGTIGDQDVIYVLSNILEQEVVNIWHKDTELPKVDGIVLPGGFSFGDYLRPGAISHYSPIMEKIVAFADDGGFLLGIGNGFQVLCECALLPGALLQNNRQKFVSKNIFVRVDNNNTIITKGIDKNGALKLPVAHSSGRYYASDSMLTEMRQNHQILLRYCDEQARISEDANPDGSVENIAGICNERQNVYGIMPHIERAADDELGNTDGLLIFNSLLKNLKHH
jgi:phosphoribosylformylglycinamidine synthase subunit PurQ / glutaminase